MDVNFHPRGNEILCSVAHNRCSQSRVTAAHEIWTSPQQSPRNTNSAAAFPPNHSCFANRPITSELASRICTQRKSAYKYTPNSLWIHPECSSRPRSTSLSSLQQVSSQIKPSKHLKKHPKELSKKSALFGSRPKFSFPFHWHQGQSTSGHHNTERSKFTFLKHSKLFTFKSSLFRTHTVCITPPIWRSRFFWIWNNNKCNST